MIQDLVEKQNKSKNSYFARQFTVALHAIGIEPSPSVVANEFNRNFNLKTAKAHTVRKWLLGQTQPKSETLLLLANWLKVDPKDLISPQSEDLSIPNRLSFAFGFTDQDVISKYLAMTIKEKVAVRMVIYTIADKYK
jgi:hypothetical protein